MVDDAKRKLEQIKYVQCYADGKKEYSMGRPRKKQTKANLLSLPCRGSLLDVSCGKGEILKIAAANGFDPCMGTEIVPELIDGDRIVYAECHSLPFTDNSFDVVTSFDVLEHLLPGDDEAACREMERVAKRYVLFTASSARSFFRGMKLHINRRSYKEWDALFRKWFSGTVTWIDEKQPTATWKVEL